MSDQTLELPESGERAADTRSPRERALTHAVYILAPLATIALLVRYSVNHELAVDFKNVYWIAGYDILHGVNPYAAAHAQLIDGFGFPYPALAALLLTPLALFGQNLSAALFVAFCLACVPATLWVLGVRDPRLYALTFVQWPVIVAWQTGNMTLAVALLVAIGWCWRDRPWPAAIAIGLAISLKLLVWPLWLWLLFTRRYRAAAITLAVGVVANLSAFVAVGQGSIYDFVKLARTITRLRQQTGYGLISIATRLGADATAGLIVGVVVVLVLVALCFKLGRGDDRASFMVAITIALAASPLVWNHYFALLIVGLAIYQPRIGPLWLGLLALWLCPSTHVALWQALLAVALVAAVTWRLALAPASADLATKGQ